MTTGAELVVLDTNVLIAATDSGREAHRRAQAAITDWPATGSTLFTTSQILREYLVVATRPVEQNGLGLSTTDAVTNVRTFGRRMRLIEETHKAHQRLLNLLDDVPCSGKQIHDANVVATALSHGVTAIATLNTADFDRFGKHVTIRGL